MSNPKVARFLRGTKLKLSKHSPAILTGVGIAGMITATVLAVKATPKALQLIEDAKDELQTDKLTVGETIKATWKCYVPAAVTCVASGGCLIFANSVNTRRNAALATAYQLSQTALSEYREKVVETIGEKKEQGIREKISEDRIKNNPVKENNIVITQKGNTLFMDPLSGQYFRSDIEQIRKIINEVNAGMMRDAFGYISLNEFYDDLGLEHASIGDELGWNVASGLIDVGFHAKLTEDDEPCIVLDYVNPPIYGYNRYL